MKKTYTFFLFMFAFFTAAQAQHQITIGAVGGAGGLRHDDSYFTNTAQYNIAGGLDLGFQIWRQLYLSGRTEVQQRYYTVEPAIVAFEGVAPQHTKTAMTHQIGLGWKTRWFYANSGVSYTDDLSGGELYTPPLSDCICIDIGSTYYLPYQKEQLIFERFNNWGLYANIGFLRALTLHSKVLVELQGAHDVRLIKSNYIKSFGALGFRLGMQYSLHR